jgi:hypothetical protein
MPAQSSGLRDAITILQPFGQSRKGNNDNDQKQGARN